MQVFYGAEVEKKRLDQTQKKKEDSVGHGTPRGREPVRTRNCRLKGESWVDKQGIPTVDDSHGKGESISLPSSPMEGSRTEVELGSWGKQGKSEKGQSNLSPLLNRLSTIGGPELIERRSLTLNYFIGLGI